MYKYLKDIEFGSNSKEYKLILARIGKNIKVHRIEMNYSLTDLSVMTDISTSYLSRVENGKALKPTIYTYLLICIALEMNPNDLFKGLKSDLFDDK